MRAAAPIEVSVKPSAAWRTVVALLCAIAVAGVAAWAVSSREQRPIAWLAAAIVASGLVALAAVRPLTLGESRLRWDGADWRFAADGTPLDDAAAAGTLQVAIDLGDWILVRFSRGSAWPRRVSWLVLERSSQGEQWHALRCAVYAGTPGRAGS